MGPIDSVAERAVVCCAKRTDREVVDAAVSLKNIESKLISLLDWTIITPDCEKCKSSSHDVSTFKNTIIIRIGDRFSG